MSGTTLHGVFFLFRKKGGTMEERRLPVPLYSFCYARRWEVFCLRGFPLRIVRGSFEKENGYDLYGSGSCPEGIVAVC